MADFTIYDVVWTGFWVSIWTVGAIIIIFDEADKKEDQAT